MSDSSCRRLWERPRSVVRGRIGYDPGSQVTIFRVHEPGFPGHLPLEARPYSGHRLSRSLSSCRSPPHYPNTSIFPRPPKMWQPKFARRRHRSCLTDRRRNGFYSSPTRAGRQRLGGQIAASHPPGGKLTGMDPGVADCRKRRGLRPTEIALWPVLSLMGPDNLPEKRTVDLPTCGFFPMPTGSLP